MICYLASKYSYRTTLLQIAGLLSMHKHEVCARWLFGEDLQDEASRQQYALMDLSDIDRCDTFILFQLPGANPEPSINRHIEFGYAVHAKKRVIVVGKRDAIFHLHPCVEHYDTIQDFLNVYANARWDGPS